MHRTIKGTLSSIGIAPDTYERIRDRTLLLHLYRDRSINAITTESHTRCPQIFRLCAANLYD